MPKAHRRAKHPAPAPDPLRALTLVPAQLAMHFADASYVLTAATGLTVRYGGDPMAWLIAVALEQPGPKFYRRLAELAQGVAKEAVVPGEFLTRGQPIERRIRALWGDNARTSWEWLLLTRPAPLDGATPLQALRDGHVARVETLLARMEGLVDP